MVQWIRQKISDWTPDKYVWPSPTKPLPNANMKCPYCGQDSGWGKVLHMVIPEEGLRCQNCGEICIRGHAKIWM